MKSRLQQAESERWPSELLYGLLVLVLTCLLAMGWLWNRLRRLQAQDGDLWRHSVMTQTEPAAELDRSKAPNMAVASAAAAVSIQPSPAPVQPVEVQSEPGRTEPTQDYAAPVAEPAPAGAEPSLDLDNLIDFDPSQGKQPPAALS